MKNLLFFSHNNKKVSEVEKILSRRDIKIYNLNFYNKIKEPIESGKSFAENAKIKSYCGLKEFKIPCFADDSGICISALKGKPGNRLDIVPVDVVSERIVNRTFMTDGVNETNWTHNVAIVHAVAGYENSERIDVCCKTVERYFQKTPIANAPRVEQKRPRWRGNHQDGRLDLQNVYAAQLQMS